MELPTLGLCTAGTEEKFFAAIDLAAKSVKPGEPFRYLEIGIAECQTLKGVVGYLHEKGWDFQAVGVDLPNANFNKERFIVDFGPHNPTIYVSPPVYIWPANGVTVILEDSARIADVLPNTSSINFCLVDACHGEPCVRRDFLSVAGLIAPGGIVAFHDAGEEEQGESLQPHCRTPIAVRVALISLGLGATIGGSSLPGWQVIDVAHGDRSRGGNSYVFAIKI